MQVKYILFCGSRFCLFAFWHETILLMVMTSEMWLKCKSVFMLFRHWLKRTLSVSDIAQ